jgi:hypothetical protein
MRNYISPVIIERLPSFIRQDYRKLTQFISHFYQFLETQGNPLEILENFIDRCEANNQVPGYIDKLMVECGFDINASLSIPKKELLLHLKDFYLSRGSEASFKFLFKVLFNVDASIDYPRKRLLIPSQATYSGRVFIFTTTFNSGTVEFSQVLETAREYDVKVFGISSKTECSVEDITQIYSKNEVYLKIQIDSPYKEFHIGEGLEISSMSSGVKIVENIIDFVDIELVNPGKNYKIGDKISISNTSVVGEARVKTLKEGSIDSLIITDGGFGYEVGDQILTNKRVKGHSFSAIVSEVDNSNNYLSVPSDSSIQLETGEFAIECWINKPNSVTDVVIATNRHATLNQGWAFKISGQKLVFEIRGAINYIVTSTLKVPNNTWIHVAATRSGNTLRLFMNGFKVAQNTVGNGDLSSAVMKLGTNYNGKETFIGYMCEFRITRGVPRYTVNFSAPTVRFENTDPLFANVALLIHFTGALSSQVFTDSSPSAKTVTTSGAIFVSNEKIFIGDRSGYFSGRGSITRTSIYNHGYNYDSLPLVEIQSKYGEDAVLTPTGDGIGQIESIEFIDPFIDSSAPTAQVISTTGTGAVLNTILKTVFIERPNWKSFEGFLGSNSTLLDSYYFQQFSYEVYSSVSRKDYDSVVDEWLHPSGFVRFSVLSIEYSDMINPPHGGFIDTFILTTIKLIRGTDPVFMVNPIYNLHWFKEISDKNYTNWVDGFGWMKEEWTNDATYYMSQGLDIYPIIKYYTIRDPRLLLNPQSRLDWFKEAQDNYSYRLSDWSDMTVGDPPQSPSEVTTNPEYLSRKKVNDDTLIMARALDAEIEVTQL